MNLCIYNNFILSRAKPVNTPVDASTKLMKDPDDSNVVDNGLYQSAKGSLPYLSFRTRPHIANDVCMYT